MTLYRLAPPMQTTRANTGVVPKAASKGKKASASNGNSGTNPAAGEAEDAAAPVPNPHAWHPSVRITSVRWNPNVAGTTLLASAAACGLVRIDWVGRA